MKTGTLTAPSDGPQTVKESFEILLQCPDLLVLLWPFTVHDDEIDQSGWWMVTGWSLV